MFIDVTVLASTSMLSNATENPLKEKIRLISVAKTMDTHYATPVRL